MKTILLMLVSSIALLAISNSALSHHSFSATFDSDKFVTVNGEITDFKFRNPHVLIYLDVTNEDGSVTNWMAEGSSATGWRRSGWQRDSLNVGEMLRVHGNATHDGSPMVSIEEFALLDTSGERVIAELSNDEDPEVSRGNTVESAETETAAEIFTIPTHLPTGEPNFTGITMQRPQMASTILGGARGEALRQGPDAYDPEHPYNEAGKAALAATDLANDPQVFCEQPGAVRQAGFTPYGFKLTQYPDHITFEYEEYGTKRAVFIGDKLPKPGRRSHMGDSVARYEDDTLIIETVNLLGNMSGHRGTPLSDEARVTEVYKRIDDPGYGSIVETTTTVVDPKYLSAPWTIKRYKLYSSDYEFIENECEPPLRERPANIYQYTEFDQQFLD